MLITLWISQNYQFITMCCYTILPVDKLLNDLLTITESGLALRAEDAVVNERVEENGKLLVD
jgi:hypothetical protein